VGSATHGTGRRRNASEAALAAPANPLFARMPSFEPFSGG